MTATATKPARAGSTGATRAPAATSRRSGRANAATQAWPRTLAGVHVQGSSLRVVIVRQENEGAAPSLVEATTIQATDTSGLTSLLGRHKPSTLVRVVSSANTVARCVAVPAGLVADRAQLGTTLALLAEAEMPAMIPAHRRAAGFIRPAPNGAGIGGNGGEAVLVVGWPERGEGTTELGAGPGGRDEPTTTWTPELAALAALARSLGGVELALYADRAAGSVSLIATTRPHSGSGMNGTSGPGAVKTVARVLRGDTTNDASWLASLQRAVSETAAALHLTLPEVEISASAPTTLVLLGSPMRRPPGMGADPSWLPQYGIAFGAAGTLADTDPGVRSLAQLRALAPRERGNIVVELVERLATGRRAAIAIGICLLLLLLWPLVIAKTREVILTTRAGGTEALKARLNEAERRVAFYKQLRENRWPMTKLIADVATAAPVGVMIDTLSVTREQGITVRGRAENSDQVTEFRSNLVASGVFGGLATPTIESESAGVVFQLEAQVASAQFPGRRAADYIKEPLAVKLYGERARDPSAPAGAPSDSTTGTSAPTPAGSTDTARPATASRSPRGTVRPETTVREDASSESRRAAASGSSIPEPLTDADIQAMDKNTAMGEWSKRKLMSTKTDDPVIKQRLIDEAARCQARFMELK